VRLTHAHTFWLQPYRYLPLLSSSRLPSDEDLLGVPTSRPNAVGPVLPPGSIVRGCGDFLSTHITSKVGEGLLYIVGEHHNHNIRGTTVSRLGAGTKVVELVAGSHSGINSAQDRSDVHGGGALVSTIEAEWLCVNLPLQKL
jgi:hypothetical protein